jgi:NitT/TauT family transport system substrate-binding protein
MLLNALVSLGLGAALPAHAADKMVIATGVDPGFSIFYVAKHAGILEKHGIDADLRTGPAGGAMVPLLISNASNASMSASFAGINNHIKDPNVVAVAQMLRYDRWYGIVAKNDVKSLADLKTRKVGVSLGNASESFWYDALKKNGLNPDEFKSAMVNVEAPEMLAALQRGNIDAFSSWEPWLSRTVLAIPNTRVLIDDLGTTQDVGFIYMNRTWIEANRELATRFMRAMNEANEFILKEPDKTKDIVGKMLNLPRNMLDAMWPKITFTLILGKDAHAVTSRTIDQLVSQGKLKPGQFDINKWFYPELLRAVKSSAVDLPAK